MMQQQLNTPSLLEDDEENAAYEEQDVSFTKYDISVSPNDFNTKTLVDFIDSGVVHIPGFQRNYVWDIKKASKLIESIIIGIPIPQIFLYEESRNKFIVIDGQQRYMTLYYFIKERFPIDAKRAELRLIFTENKGIPEEILGDNAYFIDFKLQLSEALPNKANKFNNFSYNSLEQDDKISFDLRTIRNIIIKQNAPDDEHSAAFEIFNRLNTGGVELEPQEIRASLFHSPFYDMLYRINLNNNWRKFAPSSIPDLRMKDVEILLRGFAMLIAGKTYKPPMNKFLNLFSLEAKVFSVQKISYLELLFLRFIDHLTALPAETTKVFRGKKGRFSISIYESVFVALCEKAYIQTNLDIPVIDLTQITALKDDSDFIQATQSDTVSDKHVNARIHRAKEILQ